MRYIFTIQWFPYNSNETCAVGYLIFDNKWYFLYNTQNVYNALNKGFTLFSEFDNIDKIYTSETLFKTFKQRINQREENIINEIELLSRSNAILSTDNLSIQLLKKLN